MSPVERMAGRPLHQWSTDALLEALAVMERFEAYAADLEDPADLAEWRRLSGMMRAETEAALLKSHPRN